MSVKIQNACGLLKFAALTFPMQERKQDIRQRKGTALTMYT